MSKRNKEGQFVKGNTPHNKGKNITNTGKICATCGEDKPLSDFGRDKSRSDGLYVYCKSCCKAKRQRYKEDQKKYMKEYYKENKERLLRENRGRYKENKEEYSERQKEYYRENKDRIDRTNKKWAEENRERSNEIKAKWKKENPGKAHHYTVLRRARKKNQTPEWVDLEGVREFYEECPKGMEIDHIIPLSKGGLHCLDNLQYLTPTENRKKYNHMMKITAGGTTKTTTLIDFSAI